MADTTIGRLFVDLLVRDKGFAGALGKAETELGKFGGAMSALTDGIAAKFEAGLKAASIALAGVGTASAVVGAAFEQQINKVAVLAGGGLDQLAASAREMGATTQFSATEAAAAMESLAQAGFDAERIVSGTEAALALAAASGGDLAQATAITAATMSQFNLGVADSSRIADVFTQALNTSQLNMEGLATAMSYAGPVGASFGHTLEETTAAVALFSNLGLEGSKAGTAFRMAMSAAATTTKQAEEVLAKYGLTAKDINPEIHDFGTILDTIGKAGLTASDAMVVFGTESGGAVAALAQQSQDTRVEFAKTFDGILETLETSSGAAASTAVQMQQTVAGAFEQASGAFEEVLLTLFDLYKGPLLDLLDQVQSFLNAVAKQFQRSSTSLEMGFGEMLGSITAWLDANETRLAVMIVDWTETLIDVGKVLVNIIPYLDEIAFLMGTIWAVTKIAAFVSTLQTAGSAIVALQAALAALGIQLSVMTVGVYAAAVAIGAIVAALAAYTLANREAEASAERLTAAQEKQALLNDSAFRFEVMAMEERLRALQAVAGQELRTRTDLSEARERELRQLLELSAADAVLAVRAGELIDTGEELRTTQSLVAESMDTADATKLTGAMSGLAAQERDVTQRAEELRAAIRGAQLGAEESGADIAEVWRFTARSLDGELIPTIEEAQVVLEGLESQAADLNKAQQKISNDQILAERSILQEAATAAKGIESSSRAVSDFSVTAREDTKKAAEEAAKAHEAAAKAAADAWDRGLEQAARANQERAEEDARREAEIVREGQELLNKIRLDGLTESERLVEEFGEVFLAHTEFTEEERAAVVAFYEGKIAEAVERETAATGAALEGQGEALEESADDAASWGQRVIGAFGAVAGAADSLVDGFDALVDGVTHGFEALTGLSLNLMGILADLASEMDETTEAAGRMGKDSEAVSLGEVGETRSAASSFVQNLVAESVEWVEFIVAALPTVIEELAAGIPRLIDAVVEAVPRIVDALANGIPDIVEALVDGVPRIILAVVAAVPRIVRAVVAQLPDLITALVGGLVEVVVAAIGAIPEIVGALLEALPEIIGALLDSLIAALPDLVMAIVAAVPRIILAVVAAVPQIITAVVSRLPELITTLVALVPEVIIAIAQALPQLIPAIVSLVPEVLAAVVLALPDIIVALVEGLFVELIPRLPEIAYELVRGIIVGLGNALAELADLVVETLKSAFNILGGLFSRDRDEEAYSGVNYVPATMRMTVHKGEAIVPAERNTAGARSRQATPGAFGVGMQGAQGFQVEIPIFADGRMVDGLLVQAAERGQATGVKRLARRAAGGHIGFTEGRYNRFNK